jgi:hypothetical protein
MDIGGIEALEDPIVARLAHHTHEISDGRVTRSNVVAHREFASCVEVGVDFDFE